MRVSEEPHVDILRKKAAVLESENERLSRKLVELTRELLTLKGMSPDAIALNLPGLCAQVTGSTTTSTSSSSDASSSGSEARSRPKDEEKKKKKRGHGPTEQPDLEVVQETFDLDEADKFCTECGGALEEWKGADDEVELVDVIERKWVLKKCTLKKYRCKCGGCVETADGPDKLIKGGRYTLNVAVDTAIAKYDDHIPLERQVKMARRQGMQLTTQTLWDFIWTLGVAVAPVCARIREHVLEQPVIGVDLTGFSLIKKGGAEKKQVWQLSCPDAIYFEMLDTKKAKAGARLFTVVNDRGEEKLRFGGTAVVDGASELSAIADILGFSIASCWSHARRAVLKAEKEAPGQVGQFLELVGKLYAIEHKAARDPPPDDRRRGYRHLIDLDELRALRNSESRAVCAEIKAWILEQSCIPGGLLKAGLEYVASRWTKLTLFLDDPRIPLDNNQTERSFIGLATGRRNYVGARSERGMIAASRFYTIVESARVNGVDGRAYLQYVATATVRGDVPLLPHEWARAR